LKKNRIAAKKEIKKSSKKYSDNQLSKDEICDGWKEPLSLKKTPSVRRKSMPSGQRRYE
jgi:hypothetical protein